MVQWSYVVSFRARCVTFVFLTHYYIFLRNAQPRKLIEISITLELLVMNELIHDFVTSLESLTSLSAAHWSN